MYVFVGIRLIYEWGFGICIEGCLNVVIDDVKIFDFIGDGIIVSLRGLKINNDY